MIFPLPKRVKILDVFEVYPWTVMLVFLNLLFFWMLFAADSAEKSDTEMKTQFVQRAGHYYLEWQNLTQRGHTQMEFQSLGMQAIRDSDFILAMDKWSSKTDPVGFQFWRQEFDEVFKKQSDKALAIFGVSQMDNKPLTWITYQFAHQSPIHLFSNLFFMTLFAAIVETMVGGAMLGVIYIVGGLMGAFFFMNMDQSGLIPMVGASASVTALMGFVAAGSLKRNIEYFYFLSPFQGFYGTMYLSPLWVVPLFLIEDITQVLSDPPGWGSGVAHSAHLGGAFAGLILGLAFKYGVKRQHEQERAA